MISLSPGNHENLIYLFSKVEENRLVILAKAGIQNKKLNAWIPSFEGMTMDGKFLSILFST